MDFFFNHDHLDVFSGLVAVAGDSAALAAPAPLLLETVIGTETGRTGLLACAS